MQEYEGLVCADPIHEYRTRGLETLNQARVECERVVGDMARVFGELHFISLELYTIIGCLLDVLGELSKSKALRMRIREQIEQAYGIDHPYYVRSLLCIVESHAKLGEWMEAQLLQEEVLNSAESINGRTAETIRDNLAWTYWS